jgi:hypothetical protein
MNEDLKWILIAIVVMFFISRIFDASGVTSASSRQAPSTISSSKNAPVKNQIITTKVLDAYGNVVQVKDAQY